MKVIAGISIFFLLSCSLFAQKKIDEDLFTLTGKVIGQQNGYIVLSYKNGKSKQVKDSCLLINGKFKFEGSIIEPTLAFLTGNVKSIADDDPNSTDFYIEKGKIKVVLKYNHFKDIQVDGSKTQNEHVAFQKTLETINTESQLMAEAFSSKSYEFIVSHPNSYVSAFVLALYKSRWSLDSVRSTYSKLTPIIAKSSYGRVVEKAIEEVDNNSVGKIAKPFTVFDINGAPINSSNYRGKYVLLDFWASWCLPCRQSFPHLKEIFENFHDKGFEIIAISDDDDMGAWKKAVEKDKVGIWYNILNIIRTDSLGQPDFSESINKLYGIQVLPTSILIDKEGIIIGRYIGTDENNMLEKKLIELFEGTQAF